MYVLTFLDDLLNDKSRFVEFIDSCILGNKKIADYLQNSVPATFDVEEFRKLVYNEHKSPSTTSKILAIVQNLLGFDILENMTKIPDKFLKAALIEELTVPGTIKDIGEEAFCASTIKKLKIEEGVETIDVGAFEGCKILEDTVEIPASIQLLRPKSLAFRLDYKKSLKIKFKSDSFIKNHSISLSSIVQEGKDSAYRRNANFLIYLPTTKYTQDIKRKFDLSKGLFDDGISDIILY